MQCSEISFYDKKDIVDDKEYKICNSTKFSDSSPMLPSNPSDNIEIINSSVPFLDCVEVTEETIVETGGKVLK